MARNPIDEMKGRQKQCTGKIQDSSRDLHSERTVKQGKNAWPLVHRFDLDTMSHALAPERENVEHHRQ
jgi:hypothetical protein